MIKIFFSKLKNGNLEITEKMLNDTLSYMKRQENYIKRLKQDIGILRLDIDRANSTSSEYAKRILNTLNYMDKVVFQWTEFKEIKNKLLGCDKDV